MTSIDCVFGADGDTPVTIVVATYRYRRLVDSWIEHARRAHCEHYQIVCMDERLLAHLHDRGDQRRAVSFWDAMPELLPTDVDAIGHPVRRLAALTRLRTKLFARLARLGCDFVHSDADALWLRDPRPWLLGQEPFDLLFSQATTRPASHLARHRFTLCAGFFFARSNARTCAYFSAADALAELIPSDQRRMNVLLLEDPSPDWRIVRPRLALARAPAGPRRTWRQPFPGDRSNALATRILRHPRTRMLAAGLLALVRYECMVTSPDVMVRRFDDGLSVGVIPMDMVQRVRLGGKGASHVSHLWAHKDVVDA